MASGWWKSTHTNLALGSPVDFTVTTGPKVPRGYPKIASIATGAGLYLGGTPCAVIGSVIYYAGDDYVQDTDRPVICRYDGRVSTNVAQIPYITGITPAKAILSMVANGNDLYISTWDSGTSATTFAGRVFKLPDEGAIAAFGSNIFTAGKLPYTLTIDSGNLLVGTIKQDPTKLSQVYTINLTTEATALDRAIATGAISSPAPTASRSTSTATYYITGLSAGGTNSTPVSVGSVSTDAVLDGTTYNTISWTAAASKSVDAPSTAPTASIYSGNDIGNTGIRFCYVYVTGNSLSYHTRYSSPVSVNTTDHLRWTIGGAYSTNPNVTHIQVLYDNTTGFKDLDLVAGDPDFFANNTNGGSWSMLFDGSGVSTSTAIPDTNTTTDLNATSYNVYRTAGHTSTGLIGNTASTSFTDDGDAGNGASLPGSSSVAAPTSPSVVKTDPTTTNTYVVTAINANGENEGGSVNCTAKATLSATHAIALSWPAVSGATGYSVYRTVGHTSTGRIVTNTASTSASDTGLAASGAVPTEDTTGLPIGSVGCATVFSGDLYFGLYQTSGTFPTVQKRTSAGAWSTSDTIAPGGTARSYNGFTAGIVFNSNLYLAYWNDDTTPVTLIRKFNGSSWSTVKTISGAGARPIVGFCLADSKCYAYGGGDAVTGILYSTSDGTTWTDISALLPTSKEAIPFIANTNVLG